jgi:zinc protease
LNAYEEAVDKKDDRESKALADELVLTINGRNVFTSPEESLDIIKEIFSSMTPELVHKYFMEFWDTDDLTLIYQAKESNDYTGDLMEMIYEQSQTIEVVPPAEYVAQALDHTDFGRRGTVVSDKMIEDLDIRQLVLSNNVHVNTKKTDFDDSSIILKARFGTGLLGMPANATWLDQFTTVVVNYGGLVDYSTDELSLMYAEKSVALEFGVNPGDFVFSGATTPEDLASELLLLAAYLTDPGYREESVQLFRNYIPIFMSDLEHELSDALTQVYAWLYGGDSDGRFAMPTEEILMSYKAADAKAWLHPQLTSSYLEVSIVGDLPDSTLDSILETLGAIPMRADTPDTTNIAPEIEFPTEPKSKVFTYESKIPQAYTAIVWEIPPLGESNINETRALLLLQDIYDNRAFNLVREEHGLSYGPIISADPSESFNVGSFMAYSVVSPDDATFVGELLVEIAKDLFEEGVTEDELTRVIEPKYVALADTLRSNEYWLSSVMYASQEKPYHIDWYRQRDDFYDTVTVETINKVVEYLDPEEALSVQLLPLDPKEDEPGIDARKMKRKGNLREQ